MIKTLFERKYFYIVIAFIIILFILIKIPSFLEPVWVFDEGVYAAVAHEISAHGALLYINGWDNKPPTIYLLFYLSRHIFSTYSMLPLRIFLTITEIFAGIIIYLLSKRWFNKTSAAILSLFIYLIFIALDGNIVNGEVLFLITSAISVFLIRKFDLKTPLLYLIAGFIMGIGITIKIPAVFDTAAVIYFLLLITLSNREKIKEYIPSLLLYMIGCVAPFAIYIMYFLHYHILNEFFYAVFLYNRSYIQVFNKNSFFGLGEVKLQIIVFFIFLAVLTAFYKKLNKHIFFLLLWVLCAYMAALTSGRPYLHYLMQLSVPFSLLVGIMIITWKKWIVILSFIIIYFASIYFYHNGDYYFTPDNLQIRWTYYTDAYSYLFHKTTYATYATTFGSSTNLSGYEQGEIINSINQISTPNDKIFVWGDIPWLYASAKASPICNFVLKYNFYDASTPAFAHSCVNRIMPEIFVLQRVLEPNEFNALLSAHYHLTASFPDASVYVFKRNQ